MFELSSLQPIIRDVIVNSSIRDYQKIVFHDMAAKLFVDVTIDGKLIRQPAIVIDTLEKEPALIVVLNFVKGVDEFNYTFQFEVWPTSKLLRIQPPVWLPKPVTAIPEPKMKLSFLAERNAVVYYERAFEGTFEETLKNMGQALGR